MNFIGSNFNEKLIIEYDCLFICKKNVLHHDFIILARYSETSFNSVTSKSILSSPLPPFFAVTSDSLKTKTKEKEKRWTRSTLPCLDCSQCSSCKEVCLQHIVSHSNACAITADHLAETKSARKRKNERRRDRPSWVSCISRRLKMKRWLPV